MMSKFLMLPIMQSKNEDRPDEQSKGDRYIYSLL